MTAQKVDMAGVASAVAGTSKGKSAGRDNTTKAKYWLSHRGGPFLIHGVGKGCEPQTNDNEGYLDDLDTAIEQGFFPCPKCNN